jgi:hypothetical protein
LGTSARFRVEGVAKLSILALATLQVYIWALPPSDLHHDYVFHMRPIAQHCPKPHQLDGWYVKLLDIAQKEGIIHGYESNCQVRRALPFMRCYG